ncbi:YicC/YloC family endoribonuclease [Butyrivibrio sp. AE3006]|uniref:YicC/YloC family endoribonuclease n=1 Tax=Butyrivibrio sp. AE3006 TaxID=1280673 RepID=UPI000428FE09|nr:YicC/YloC family endoribonuclease [Butyrivibrio sp. AE3006]
MVCSMTGYGRCEVADEKHKFTVEMKSVNNRYLDINIKMPKKFNALESKIRNELKKFIKRGKVDVFISYEDFSETDSKVKYNKAIAEEYLTYLKQMSEDFGIDNDIRVSSLSKYPDVFSMEDVEPNEDEMWEQLKKTVDGAGEEFAASRSREGEFLRQDLEEKLSNMMDSVEFITERSPIIIEEYRNRLRDKVKELLEDKAVDENRLIMEVTLYADKVSVDEELVRLRSHIKAMKDELNKGDDKDGIGRKLDFLAQEMNRESNTILSKSTDLEISDRGISLKTDVEKVREQIQNIE